MSVVQKVSPRKGPGCGLQPAGRCARAGAWGAGTPVAPSLRRGSPRWWGWNLRAPRSGDGAPAPPRWRDRPRALPPVLAALLTAGQALRAALHLPRCGRGRARPLQAPAGSTGAGGPVLAPSAAAPWGPLLAAEPETLPLLLCGSRGASLRQNPGLGARGVRGVLAHLGLTRLVRFRAQLGGNRGAQGPGRLAYFQNRSCAQEAPLWGPTWGNRRPVLGGPRPRKRGAERPGPRKSRAQGGCQQGG